MTTVSTVLEEDINTSALLPEVSRLLAMMTDWAPSNCAFAALALKVQLPRNTNTIAPYKKEKGKVTSVPVHEKNKCWE